ncbi:uncharacterized protein K02A2.6-like [Melanotaenia boesemani]|uniref:uncharacterized protein K02A2.6-like n=1 Tax=Melanotaenia boesemani TaxID=1250792 RepID=UPI001C043064|nr:uncharacterized protein K02A2.6-like [Melanotaenia boesemani]
MNVTVGNLSAFDSKEQTWEEYCEILDQFFEANDIDDGGKQRAVLISVVGPATYKLIRNLVSPDKPSTKTYSQIVAIMKDHFNPKPSEIVQRYKFDSRSRQPNETVSAYVAELRRLAQDCNFGATLEQMLRDRLVCGINDDRIQRRLLSESDLTFEKAFQIAVAAEAATKNVQDLQTRTQYSCNSVSLKGQEKKGNWRNKECYRCNGKQHNAVECKFKEAKCHACGKVGHIARACRNKNKRSFRTDERKPRKVERPRRPQEAHKVCEKQGDESSSEQEEAFTLACIKTETSVKRTKPFEVKMEVNKKKVNFEIDTGCSVSVMNETKFKGMWKEHKRPQLRGTKITLRSYTGEEMKVVGVADVEVTYAQQVKILPLVVVKGTGPSLLGRAWLKTLKLKWDEIKYARTETQGLQQVLSKHEDVFKEELGMLQGMKASIRVSPEARPKFYRPRSVPYAMRAKVDVELERLQRQGIISPVKYAEWAAPIVPVLKPDGDVRVCGDFKLTVNSASSLEQYPIPRVEDLFHILAGGKQFSKLDLSHAYQQIVMDEESKRYLTVNTHRGLFTYNRLPFGVSSAPAIFQRTMESLLQGLPGVAVYLDDILVTGKEEAEHLSTLDEVLRRLKEAGLRLRRRKCAFLRNEVEYLGHMINAEGLHPVQSKVTAIEEAPRPTNVTELKAYLGLLNYYNKFLPNLATHLAPLHQLLRKESQWTWNKEQEDAFSLSKQMLKSTKVLSHYSADKELVLACDASPYGVGAVLSHVMEDGSEKPLGFMSRTLTPAEKRYSQLDKEGLAIMFGIKRFHKYIYGRMFTISTDHKPLISLFHEKKPVPQMGSPRVQRWAVLLRAYEYKIMYKPGKEHANADALSRLPLPHTEEEDDADHVLMLDVMEDPPITTAQVKQWTAKDVALSKVLLWCLKGWPKEVDAEFKPFSQRRLELSVTDGCVLWGARVVVPKRGRSVILKQLHNTHPGISRMKGLARSHVWWPGMDSDIEKEVQSCHTCQQNSKSPAGAPLHPWEWPETPWSRLHIDYAGPYLGKMFLIIVDAHSKWIDAYLTNSATSQVTIEKLRQCFSTHGLPQTIVSDNGTCFTSQEFKTFLKQNGIQHKTSAPFHPASNGLAERAVQTFKQGITKTNGDTLETKIARFLFNYRITPQSTTGLSPAEMLMSRRLRSTLDLLLPDVKSKIRKKQLKQKEHQDTHTKWRSFASGDEVYVRNYSHGPRWIPAVIDEHTGPVSYTVQTGDGRVMRRHVDQVRKRHASGSNVSSPEGRGEPDSLQLPRQPGEVEPADSGIPAAVREEVIEQPEGPAQVHPPAEHLPESGAEPSRGLRRSERTRQTPAYLKDFVR